jgi:CheY-like chemotaxis protein
MSVQKKILVVEDVADTRKLFTLSLTHFGFEVFEAIDGIEGLERTASVHPDLIIMDIRMPRMDGLEAMTRLKADSATRNIPILVATANTDKIEIQTLREAGACDVLIKPIELKILRQTVERYVSGRDLTAPPRLLAGKNLISLGSS